MQNKVIITYLGDDMNKQNNTKVIYLTGKPGVGKYTIAKELAKNYGFIICDNQLINNPIFELLQYDGYGDVPEFAWDSISRIRNEVLSFLSKESQHNYILTNCLADTKEDKGIYEQVRSMAEARGSDFYPVALTISKEEHLKRLTRTERLQRFKSIDPKDAEDNGALIAISHPNLLALEISNLSAKEAAKKIMEFVGSSYE